MSHPPICWTSVRSASLKMNVNWRLWQNPFPESVNLSHLLLCMDLLFNAYHLASLQPMSTFSSKWVHTKSCTYAIACTMQSNSTSIRSKLSVVPLLKGIETTIEVKLTALPYFCKNWPVLWKKVETQSSLWSVNKAEWAIPIVVVPEGDNSISICGDFKVTF